MTTTETMQVSAYRISAPRHGWCGYCPTVVRLDGKRRTAKYKATELEAIKHAGEMARRWEREDAKLKESQS